MEHTQCSDAGISLPRAGLHMLVGLGPLSSNFLGQMQDTMFRFIYMKGVLTLNPVLKYKHDNLTNLLEEGKGGAFATVIEMTALFAILPVLAGLISMVFTVSLDRDTANSVFVTTMITTVALLFILGAFGLWIYTKKRDAQFALWTRALEQVNKHMTTYNPALIETHMHVSVTNCSTIEQDYATIYKLDIETSDGQVLTDILSKDYPIITNILNQGVERYPLTEVRILDGYLIDFTEDKPLKENMGEAE